MVKRNTKLRRKTSKTLKSKRKTSKTLKSKRKTNKTSKSLRKIRNNRKTSRMRKKRVLRGGSGNYEIGAGAEIDLDAFLNTLNGESIVNNNNNNTIDFNTLYQEAVKETKAEKALQAERKKIWQNQSDIIQKNLDKKARIIQEKATKAKAEETRIKHPSEFTKKTLGQITHELKDSKYQSNAHNAAFKDVSKKWEQMKSKSANTNSIIEEKLKNILKVKIEEEAFTKWKNALNKRTRFYKEDDPMLGIKKRQALRRKLREEARTTPLYKRYLEHLAKAQPATTTEPQLATTTEPQPATTTAPQLSFEDVLYFVADGKEFPEENKLTDNEKKHYIEKQAENSIHAPSLSKYMKAKAKHNYKPHYSVKDLGLEFKKDNYIDVYYDYKDGTKEKSSTCEGIREDGQTGIFPCAYVRELDKDELEARRAELEARAKAAKAAE